MCCELCQLEKTDPTLYAMKTQWLSHAQLEEFHQKHQKGNRDMFGYHKEKRIELEKKIRGYRQSA